MSHHQTALESEGRARAALEKSMRIHILSYHAALRNWFTGATLRRLWASLVRRCSRIVPCRRCGPHDRRMFARNYPLLRLLSCYT
jgi:hypothetical protein